GGGAGPGRGLARGSGSPRNRESRSAAASFLWPLDAATGGDVLGVIGQQRLRQPQHRLNPPVGDPVEHQPPLPTRLDKAAPAKTSEMIGHLWLRQAEPLHQRADGQLALALQELENPQTTRIAEPAEVLRHEIRLQRSRGEPERSSSDRARHVATYIICF